jgi:hypothetical protein
MIAESDYRTVTYFGNGRALDVLWDAWQGSEIQSFDQRRDVFLWILERLLKEGSIKLHKSGVFLESAIEDQIEAFRHAWPKNIKNSGYEDFYWWFFDPECPAGIAWRREDGSYEIAD